MKVSVRRKNWNIQDFNFRLLIEVLALSIIGILLVNSATKNEVQTTIVSTTVKQILGVVIGLALAVTLAILDYRKITKHAMLLYVLSILSLIYVLVFTSAIYGAKRWIRIPLFGTIQPSEFAKPALILFLAFVSYYLEERISRPVGILLFFLASAPVLLLTLLEPDLSTGIVLICIVIISLFLSGISYKWVIGGLCLLVPLVLFLLIAVYQEDQPILNAIFEDHQVERINAYFFPDNYPDLVRQQQNSIMAIGSGGFFGKGLNTTSLESVKNGKFLSEESCDFIVAVLGEEMGFLGCIVVIGLTSAICVECFQTAKKCPDRTGRIIAGTIGATIGIQSFINFGVATLLIPNTGIPLPFVSAGLSSLLTSYFMIGMVLSIRMHGTKRRRSF